MEPLDRPSPQDAQRGGGGNGGRGSGGGSGGSGAPAWSPMRLARRLVVAVTGTTVVLVGIALLALPGPGVLTILVGLGMLSVEFAFAQRWMAALQARASNAADRAGVPRRWRVAFPVLAIMVAVLAALTPLFVSLVRTSDGFTLVHKSTLSFRYGYATEDELRTAAAGGDALAAGILQRATASTPAPEATPTPAPAPTPTPAPAPTPGTPPAP